MSRRSLTREGARNRLIGQCREAGGVQRWANRHCLSRKHVDAIIAGEVEMSEPVAVAIGLRREVIYVGLAARPLTAHSAGERAIELFEALA